MKAPNTNDPEEKGSSSYYGSNFNTHPPDTFYEDSTYRKVYLNDVNGDTFALIMPPLTSYKEGDVTLHLGLRVYFKDMFRCLDSVAVEVRTLANGACVRVTNALGDAKVKVSVTAVDSLFLRVIGHPNTTKMEADTFEVKPTPVLIKESIASRTVYKVVYAGIFPLGCEGTYLHVTSNPSTHPLFPRNWKPSAPDPAGPPNWEVFNPDDLELPDVPPRSLQDILGA